jgi:hypothetical protein
MKHGGKYHITTYIPSTNTNKAFNKKKKKLPSLIGMRLTGGLIAHHVSKRQQLLISTIFEVYMIGVKIKKIKKKKKRKHGKFSVVCKNNK